MEKEVKIAIIGALAVIAAAVFPVILEWYSERGDGQDSTEAPEMESFESDEVGPKEVEEKAVSEEAEISEEPPKLDSLKDSLKPDKPSPQETGTAIRWTARAEDPDDETLYYRFQLKGPSTGGSWDEVQDWSTSGLWEWEPSEAGSYNVQVEVRDGDHAGPEGNDDYKTESYEISEEPPDLKSLEHDKPSPQETGTAISWTAIAEDPDDETLSYRFLLMSPSTGGSWDEVQDWSPQSRWGWTPSEAGSYKVKVEARYEDEGGSDGKYASSTTEESYKILVAISEEDPAVAVSSWGQDRLDLFVRGPDGALWHRDGDGRAWSDWEQLDEDLLNSAPAAVSRGPDTIDVFARGEDNDLIHKRLEGSTWTEWESLGGPINKAINSAPAASSWGEDRLDVFVRGTDDAIWHKWAAGSNWSDWESLGGTLTSAPAAVSWGPDAIQVFVRETERDISHRWWDGSTWSDWESLGGTLTSAPAASSKVQNKLHVFARGGDNMLWCKYWVGNEWRGWIRVPSGRGELTSAPAAVSWGSDRIDIFYKGTDNYLMHEKFDGGWRAPESMGKLPLE